MNDLKSRETFKKMIQVYKTVNIIFDIDGTLTYHQDKINESILEKIEYLRSKGCKFTIATGRSVLESMSIIQQIKPDMPVIYFDGQLVFDMCKNQVIENRIVPEDIVHVVVKALEPDFFVFLEKLNIVYAQSKFEQMMFSKAFSISRNNIVVCTQIPAIFEVNRIYIRSREYLKIEPSETIKAIAQRYNLQIQKLSEDWLVLTTFADKTMGFTALMKQNFLRAENTLFFGDGGNDVELLKYLQYSIAMGNACIEAKQSAKYYVDSVHDIGVGKGLQVLIEIFEKMERI